MNNGNKSNGFSDHNVNSSASASAFNPNYNQQLLMMANYMRMQQAMANKNPCMLNTPYTKAGFTPNSSNVQNYYNMNNSVITNSIPLPQPNGIYFNCFSSPYSLSTPPYPTSNGIIFTAPYSKPMPYNQVNRQRPTAFNNNFSAYRNYSNYNNMHESRYPQERKPSPKLPPEEIMEIDKWIQSRKRNYPTTEVVKEKQCREKKKEDIGMLSKLEVKLREKVKLLKNIDGKRRGNMFFRKERMPGNNFNFNRRRRRNNNRMNHKKNDAIEEGEIREEEGEGGDIQKGKEERTKEEPKKEKANTQKRHAGFKYKRSTLYEEMSRSEKYKELNIILQAFRYFVNENLV